MQKSIVQKLLPIEAFKRHLHYTRASQYEKSYNDGPTMVFTKNGNFQHIYKT